MDLTGKPFYLSKEEANQVVSTVSNMTQDEKIGQLFVVLGDAYETKELTRLVKEFCIGGVLFRPGKSREIAKKYQRLNEVAKYPLLRCANLEEGGAGVLTDGTYFGSEMQVAATKDMEMTRKFAAVCAEEGKSVGVNWNFAPVCDIDFNFRNPITNVRTFGSDVETVKNNAVSYVEELQSRGVAAACKHFPGDGVDDRDQHLHPTINSLSAKQWFDSYGKVYQACINAGLMSVMVGHIIAPNVIKRINRKAGKEDFLPASMSPEMLEGVLRKRMGFNGVIITDATIMGGYTMALPRREALPKTIACGCDMICFTPDIYEDLEWIRLALSEGRLSTDRLDQAVMRSLAMRLSLEHGPKKASEIQAKKWAEECSNQAITLVKDTQELVPVTKKTFKSVRIAVCGEDGMYDGLVSGTAEKYFRKLGFETELYDPFADDLHGTKDLPKDRLTVILLNYPTASNQVVVRPNWCPKHALEIPRFVNEESLVAISLCNPYHLQDLPRIKTYINTYAATKTALIQALDKLCGKSPFVGSSPVDPFCGLEDTRY